MRETFVEMFERHDLITKKLDNIKDMVKAGLYDTADAEMKVVKHLSRTEEEREAERKEANKNSPFTIGNDVVDYLKQG